MSVVENGLPPSLSFQTTPTSTCSIRISHKPKPHRCRRLITLTRHYRLSQQTRQPLLPRNALKDAATATCATHPSASVEPPITPSALQAVISGAHRRRGATAPPNPATRPTDSRLAPVTPRAPRPKMPSNLEEQQRRRVLKLRRTLGEDDIPLELFTPPRSSGRSATRVHASWSDSNHHHHVFPLIASTDLHHDEPRTHPSHHATYDPEARCIRTGHAPE
ncbi:hypothetical protein BJ912DRAFT_678188 [Pholiota molesta]|nr:hypothetical protein BJ912DRAFT_678188 [Pholiota molesta]